MVEFYKNYDNCFGGSIDLKLGVLIYVQALPLEFSGVPKGVDNFDSDLRMIS